MTVEKTTDTNYPIKISDGWGGKIYIHISDIENLDETINKLKDDIIKAMGAN